MRSKLGARPRKLKRSLVVPAQPYPPRASLFVSKNKMRGGRRKLYFSKGEWAEQMSEMERGGLK